MKIVTMLLLSIALVGCAHNDVTEVRIQKVKVPVLYCPAPSEVERPVITLNTLTEEELNNPGIVAKHYKATVRALLGYAEQLETQLEFYDDTSAAYKKLSEKFDEETTDETE